MAPDIYLSVRWAWRMSDCFDPDQLEPDVKYDPQQLFWQRNECADGISYVQGDLCTPLPSVFWLLQCTPFVGYFLRCALIQLISRNGKGQKSQMLHQYVSHQYND